MSRQENNLIKDYIRQLKRDLNLISQHKSSIIFTGLTGSGKGTLIHYLTKNRRLYAQTSQTGDMIIQLKQKINGKDSITISSKMQSDTLIPQQIAYKGQIYRDLPGFMDNRDDQKFIPQDITNSFFIHEVFQKTDNVKIAFVSSKNSLNDKAIQFVLTLTQFAQRFENINQIIKSIFLVVTKVPTHLEIKHIKFILQKIVSDLKHEITQNTRKILQQWISNSDSHIQLFKVPEKQGPLNFSQVDNFHKKLKGIPYSPSPAIKNVISEYSLAKMVDLQEKWNHAISEICYDLIKSSYEDYLKKIQKIRMLNTAKSSLNYLRHRLDQLMGTQNPQDFKNRLKNVPELHAFSTSEFSSSSKSQQLMIQFQQYYDFLQLFQKIHPQIHNTPKWKEPLYKIHHSISQIVSQPWQEIHGQDIFIKGFVVESVTIQKKINFYSNKLISPQIKGKVVIFAYFFIMNEDIVYPGGNVMIYAHYFIAQQRNAKIRLNGENAKDYSVMTDDDNCHGQPGRPGQNAGNLLLKVYERCDNLEYFSVDLRGGRGGKGKNGGQIKLSKANKLYINYLLQDRKLPTSQKKFLLYREDYKFEQRNIISKISQVFRILGTYNGQVVEFYSTQIDIENSLSNFAYTLGGIGGKPGNSGNIHIDIGDKIVQVIDKPEPSTNGQAHVEVYQGLYVKEMIFPNFREQGRQINIKSMIEQKKFQMQYQKIQQEMRLLCQKKKSRMRKMSSNTQISISSPQKQKQKGENNPWTADELKKMVIQARNQIQEQEEISTPLLYKKKYKQQTEYFDQELVIRQEDNQQQDYEIDQQSIKVQKVFKKNMINSETKIGFEAKNVQLRRGGTAIDFKPPQINFLKRKQQRKNINPTTPYTSRSTLQSYEESVNENSSKISKMSQSNRTIKSISSSQPSGRTLTSRLLQPKKPNLLQNKLNFQTDESESENKSITSISNSELLINKLKQQMPRWGKQVTKEVATDIGTGTFQKLAQRIINKVCQKALRTGFTMQKEVLKQFVENALKSQTEKKLLAQLGILTGQSFSKQIAKAAALKIEENIITNLGKQVIRDTAGILERQALKHLGEDIAKVGVKRLGSQAAKEAEIQLAAKSLSSGTVYMQGMLEGLGKSVLFQIFLSALMASGITDSWIIKPHFKSKKMDLKIYNQENIQQPQPHYDFTVQEMKFTQEQYKFFVSSFRQFHSVFANKT